MSTFDWMAAQADLSPVALTVRAQAISPDDRGNLSYTEFFPNRDVPSVDLRDITSLDRRAAADRREWNAPGRYIPMLTPQQREISMVPIEAYDKIEEKEMQKLAEGAQGNAAIIQRVIGADLPSRVDELVRAIYRRLELDSMTAWANGYIRQYNPQQGGYYEASFGFSNTRLTTAGTAWNAAASAYDAFIAWYLDAADLVGGAEGVVLRRATLNAILEDAPDLANGVKMNITQLASRVQQDLGEAFTFIVNENQLDVFDDGGMAVTRTKVWPAQKVAVIPTGRQVGVTANAPVKRAMDLANTESSAGISTRGVVVFHFESNNGKELTIEAQKNAMPIPDEQRVAVIDAGV
jgi:hypothetical protein